MHPLAMSNSIFFFVIIIIIIIIPSSFSVSFNLSTIDPEFLNFKAAYENTSSKLADQSSYRAGWGPYTEPLHLWDRGSGSLTDFTTHFSFVMGPINNLTFLLTPNGSLTKDWYKNQSSEEEDPPSIVVLFDNLEQQVSIGMNLVPVESVNTTTWHNINATLLNDAWISYSATSMTMTVQVTDLSGNRLDSLTCVVDVRTFLPEYVTFGFVSTTPTEDPLPTHILRSWQFSSSFNMPSSFNTPSPQPAEYNNNNNNNNNKVTLTVGLSVGVPIIVFFFGVALASFCLWKKKYNKGSRDDGDEYLVDTDMDMEFEKGTGAKRFSYGELALATKGFAENEKLGEGGFGGVYRGFLKETESHIAVKRVSRGSKQGLKEYASEVKIISQLRHRNLVQLLGWCHQKGELLLVYEFMPNGSLDSHLFKSKSMLLTWEVRYKIAQGLASALFYLHEEWERCVVHRDIKSSNIMLDSNFNAKLGDFGLARLVDHEKGSQTTVLAGTMGYMAPECAVTGRASKETDVYSFGIVLLEICCGRRPIDSRYQEENRVVLVEWVWSLYGMGKLLEAADPRLSTEFDEREMEQMMIVGLWCAHLDRNHRPSIRQAIQVLNFEVALPTLPPALPLPMYVNPTASTTSMELDSNKYSNCSSSSSITAR